MFLTAEPFLQPLESEVEVRRQLVRVSSLLPSLCGFRVSGTHAGSFTCWSILLASGCLFLEKATRLAAAADTFLFDLLLGDTAERGDDCTEGRKGPTQSDI